MDTEPKLLNITQLAAHTGIPKRTLFDMVKEKRFPVDPIVQTHPRKWSREQVDRWLAGEANA